jgi:hypothetical protein
MIKDPMDIILDRMGDIPMTDIVDASGYCSVHESYHCDCYRPSKKKAMYDQFVPFPTAKTVRSVEWLRFSKEVFQHIETYTVPQYGDKGSDQCSEFSESDFITQMKKYLNRYGKNSRDGQQQLDLLKIAHYACMLHAKRAEEDADLKRIINHE